MANEKEIKPTDQRIAAEVDAVLYKVITDLHTYSENPMDPEEVLKFCKEKSKEQVPPKPQRKVMSHRAVPPPHRYSGRFCSGVTKFNED